MKTSLRRLAMVAALALVVALPAITAEAGPGFTTSAASMLTGVGGTTVKPLVTVGETLPGGVVFEGIPDGIAVDPNGGGEVNIYVNHELSTVPFFNVADTSNSTLDYLTLEAGSGAVLSSAVVIGSSSNFQRFCSNFLAFAGDEQSNQQGGGQGNSNNNNDNSARPLVLTNEESNDLVNRTGVAWPPGVNAEQAGYVVAFDPQTGEHKTIPGMGRHNHENAVAIPAYDKAVILSGDDTFDAPASQMYMYIADNRDAVWNDTGHLYAFKSSEHATNDYGDLTLGEEVSGTFIPVPDNIADGGQAGLEAWSNSEDVFQFIRIEDIAYDRNQSNIVYFADTGEPRAKPGGAGDRLLRGSSTPRGPYSNGRIFKMVLNEENPLVVDSLSILINADVSPWVRDVNAMHQPDNLETTRNSILIQEDPGSHNQWPASDATGTPARIWRYDLQTGALTVVAKVNQSLLPTESQGNWESSGIVDASAYFGPGTFLVDIQAHNLIVGTSTTVPNPVISANNPGATNLLRREGGQLLLITVPGA